MRRPAIAVLGACLLASPALADRIELRPRLPDQAGTMLVLYRADHPPAGRAMFSLEWTDALGRVVARRRFPVSPGRHRAIGCRLDMRRAITAGNSLRVRLVPAAASPTEPARDVTLTFAVRLPAQPWRDWQIIAYQPQDPVRLAGLARLGVTAGRVLANRDDTLRPPVGPAVAPFLQQNLRWYVENIATDFYAAYHRWLPDRPVNAAFLAVQARHRQDPADAAVFIRHPSLSDPAWLAKIHDRLVRTVQDQAAYRPLYYNLADEAGIGDLAAAWDFDLSAPSLAGMRDWLHTGYRSLGALNRQWGARFARWDQVVPMTTDRALLRADDNFSAWSDFKAWMDVAFARALRAGTRAVHAADPTALAAIEGAQIPGWGGYDYTRLPHSVDAMELYDAGENVDIARSLAPDLVMLTTVFGDLPAQTHAVWRALLQGMRGMILWDPAGDLVGPDGSPGAWGRQAAPLFAAFRSGLGTLMVNSRPDSFPVATLYSPASQRIQWLLERRAQGTAWADRDAEAENQDNRSRAAMGFFSALVRHLGVEQRFLSPALVASGALRPGHIRVLILPRIIALSAAEAGEIRRFVAHGGTVIADSVPGAYDEHGRRLPHPALAALFAAPPAAGRAVLLPPSSGPADLAALRQLRSLVAQAGVQPAVAVTTASGDPATDVAIYRRQFGATTIVGLLPDLRIAGSSGQAETLVVTLRRPASVEDLRSHADLGVTDRLSVTADPLAPALLALSAARSPAPRIAGPARGEAGRDAWFSLRAPATRRAEPGVLDVAVFDPSGQAERRYAGAVLVPRGGSEWRLPLALNDPAGVWKIRFTDAAGGRSTIVRLAVAPAARRDPGRP